MILDVQIKDGAAGRRSGEGMTEQEALELVLSGSAVLVPHQVEPPFYLLEAMDGRVAESRVFGPAVERPSQSEAIAKHLFAHGIRQQFVQEHSVRWFKSGRQFQTAAEVQISNCSQSQTSLFAQVRNVLQTAVSKYGKTLSLPSGDRPNEEERRWRCLIFGRRSNFLLGTVDYVWLPEEWFEYRLKLRELEARLNETIQNALAAGRIVVSKGSDDRASYLPPEQAKKVPYHSAKSDYSFCFSRDLPVHWFAFERPLHVRRKRAGEWMIRVEEHCSQSGKRISRDDLMLLASKKFSLTENAAKEALKSVRQKIGGARGKIPNGQHVDLSEIKDIE